MKKVVAAMLFMACGVVFAKEPAVISPSAIPQSKTLSQFYVYKDQGARENHFIPSGWMGDYGDIHMTQGFSEKKGDKQTRIQIKYSGERKQGAGWAGIYWQSPANNWGDKKGGFNLSGFTKLTFNARGDKGGELIDKFMIGGITGQAEDGDTDEASSDQIELTKDWKTYTIDLSKADLSHIIGGFGFAMNADSNPNGATFYLDDIVLTK